MGYKKLCIPIEPRKIIYWVWFGAIIYACMWVERRWLVEESLNFRCFAICHEFGGYCKEYHYEVLVCGCDNGVYSLRLVTDMLVLGYFVFYRAPYRINKAIIISKTCTFL